MKIYILFKYDKSYTWTHVEGVFLDEDKALKIKSERCDDENHPNYDWDAGGYSVEGHEVQ